MKKILALITILIISRIYITQNLSYLFIFWNILLALIPYVSIYFIKTLKTLKEKILFLIFIIFYPNAPYLVTDLIHLSNYNFYKSNNVNFKFNSEIIIWNDFLLLTLTAMLGILLSYVMMTKFKNLFNQKKYSLIVLSILTGIAIYIGRFFRFNSWDLVVRPIDILKELFESLNALNITLILIFSILNYSIYLMLDSKE